MLSTDFWHGFAMGLVLFLASTVVVYLISYVHAKPASGFLK